MQDTLAILESVNNFYSQSFSHLISITLAVLAFSGVVLPVLFGLYQKRLFKLDHKEIEASLSKRMYEILQGSVDSIDEKISIKEKHLDEKLKLAVAKVQQDIDRIAGGLSHVQGNKYLSEKNYVFAFESFIGASFSYIESSDDRNLQRVLRLMTGDCFPNLTANDIEHHPSVFSSYIDVVDKLKKYNKNRIYSDQIDDIERAYLKAKKNNTVA